MCLFLERFNHLRGGLVVEQPLLGWLFVAHPFGGLSVFGGGSGGRAGGARAPAGEEQRYTFEQCTPHGFTLATVSVVSSMGFIPWDILTTMGYSR